VFGPFMLARFRGEFSEGVSPGAFSFRSGVGSGVGYGRESKRWVSIIKGG
jgi:hypothetical protein